MKITHSKVPSKEAQLVLDALKSAVMTELEKKRKLGHYIVTWDDITKPGSDRCKLLFLHDNPVIYGPFLALNRPF